MQEFDPMIRNNVTFRCPEPFVPVSEEDGVLSITGADWFAAILRRIASLEVDPEFCQEDWGVVYFVSRNRKKFWIGLSMGPDADSEWLAHVHHHSLAWLQRFSSSGKREMDQLIMDLHHQFSATPTITAISWYHESDMRTPHRSGSPLPR